MSPILNFPSRAELARAREVVAVTGDEALTVENLRAAYAHGIFPWPGRPKVAANVSGRCEMDGGAEAGYWKAIAGVLQPGCSVANRG